MGLRSRGERDDHASEEVDEHRVLRPRQRGAHLLPYTVDDRGQGLLLLVTCLCEPGDVRWYLDPPSGGTPEPFRVRSQLLVCLAVVNYQVSLVE